MEMRLNTKITFNFELKFRGIDALLDNMITDGPRYLFTHR